VSVSAANLLLHKSGMSKPLYFFWKNNISRTTSATQHYLQHNTMHSICPNIEGARAVGLPHNTADCLKSTGPKSLADAR
jgi:hypothetical protein